MYKFGKSQECLSFFSVEGQLLYNVVLDSAVQLCQLAIHIHICIFIYIQVKKQQLEWDMEQQTGCKSGKKYIKAVYCHLAYLTSMQVHHEKRWAGESTSWNQDHGEKYQ